MTKRAGVTISVNTVEQAWVALKLPALADSAKRKLMDFLAANGGLKYARKVMDGGLCKDLPASDLLKQRFLKILVEARDHNWLPYAFRTETDPQRRADILELIATVPWSSYMVLCHHARELSTAEQERLARTAFRTDRWVRRALDLLEDLDDSTPALRACVLNSLGVGRWAYQQRSDFAERILSEPTKYFPESAPMTREERHLLFQRLIEDGVESFRILYEFPSGKVSRMNLSLDEVRSAIPSILAFYAQMIEEYGGGYTHEMRSVLSNSKVMELFSEEQKTELAALAQPKAA